VVDVRAAEDYAEGHIPGAVNVPKDKWGQPEGLRKDKINVLYCYSQVCHLAAAAAVEFASKGYPVMELEGGVRTWKDGELEIEKAGISIGGMSDHTVSQSLYLADPDGNEVELYVDADEAIWRKDPEAVLSEVRPLRL